MFNHFLNGKNIDGGIACPVCGGSLEPDNMEVRNDLGPYIFMQDGLKTASPGRESFTLGLLCTKCFARVDIEADCATLECRENEKPKPELEYTIMSITSVKYGRVRNIGNYGTERFEATADIVAGMTASDAADECRAFVQKRLGLGPTPEELRESQNLIPEGW